jgi:hypothetical protein
MTGHFFKRVFTRQAQSGNRNPYGSALTALLTLITIPF